MKVEFVDAEGNKTTVDVGDITPEDLQKALRPTTTPQKLRAFVNNLKIPKEAKLLLLKLQKVVIRAGRAIYKIGIKMLEIIVLTVHKHPEIAVSMIIAAILAMILSMIPWVGHLLAVLVAAIAVALGFAKALINPNKDDQVNGEIRAKIREIFQIIEGGVVA